MKVTRNQDLPDVPVNYVTVIYQYPITRENEEGVAKIRKVISSDEHEIQAMVEFLDEPGETYFRTIHRKDFIKPQVD